MPIEILMPALSPTMEEGTLAKWLVKPGDQVASGDVIAEIETDKATMEVEAVDEGTVGQIVVAAGTEGVAVNKVIAILLEDGEGAFDITQPASVAAPAPSMSAATSPVPASATVPDAVGIGAGPVVKTVGGDLVPSSPLARRLAKMAGIDLSGIVGTGPNGRIVKADVEKAKLGASASNPSAATAPTSSKRASFKSAPAPSLDDATVLKLFPEGSYDIVPHDGMRKTIARRLTEAKQTVPHFYLTIDLRIDALLALRAELNAAAPTDADGKPAYKLSVNDLVIKAHALALKAVPAANASWTDGGMLMHKSADVGVAVAIEGGLITPIIRAAESKTLSTISTEMKDLAGRARNRKLLPHEYQGGTTAISNLGMFGIKDFCAVINPPHATILAIGAGRKEPVVENGDLAVGTLMSVTLSTDHRAVDGALGAELLQAFKSYIEKPMSMLV